MNDMTRAPKRDELLQMIQDARVEWEATTALMKQEEREQPVLDGWSVKDVTAHLMWHEQEMLGVVRERRLAGSDLWQHTTDERNQLIHEQYRDLPLSEIREQERNVHEALVRALEGLSDADLADPSRWRDFPPEWQAWQIIAQNTYEHVRHHTADVQRYLASTVP